MQPIEPKSHSRLARVMQELYPGDLITHFDCLIHGDHSVLVLGKKGPWLDLSVMTKSGEAPIILDHKGPYRWDTAAEAFLNKDGESAVGGHIAPGIHVYKGGGNEWVEVYRSLPDPNSDRWNIGTLISPSSSVDGVTAAKIKALIHRAFNNTGDGPKQVGRTIAHLIELAFAGREHALDARAMTTLNLAVAMISKASVELGEKIAMKKARSGRSNPLEDLLRRGDVGIDIVGIGPDGEEMDLEALFGEGGRTAGLPPELREVIAALTGRRRGARPNGDGRPDRTREHAGGGMPG